ncbi:MAG: hypothetical protein ACREPP_05185 [Rhodanobacteraceae bacterium]
MLRSNNLAPAVLAVLLSTNCFVAKPARADDASCKPLSDAMIKAASTPYHEFTTAGGESFEKIYTTKALYIGSHGHWMKTDASPQILLDALRQSGAAFTECKALRTETVDGQAATVYAAHEHLASIGEDDHSQIWIGNANGLPLKSESDSQRAGRTSHVSAHFTYGNVQPPAGVQ